MQRNSCILNLLHPRNPGHTSQAGPRIFRRPSLSPNTLYYLSRSVIIRLFPYFSNHHILFFGLISYFLACSSRPSSGLSFEKHSKIALEDMKFKTPGWLERHSKIESLSKGSKNHSKRPSETPNLGCRRLDLDKNKLKNKRSDSKLAKHKGDQVKT